MIEEFRFLLRPATRPDVHFLAPMPLEECIERLEHRHGTFFDIKTEVIIGQVDADQCTLEMRVQRLGKGAFDITVHGTLSRQDASTTQVIIASSYVSHMSTTPILIGMMVFIGIIMILVVKNVLVLIFPLLFSIVFVLAERDNFKSVVRMIEETLGARTPSDKAKNSEAA